MRIAAVQGMVNQECGSKKNVFGPAFFEQHLAVVAEYGALMAARLAADREVVELAAWLHDISAVRDVSTMSDHASLSAEIAIQVVSEAGYPTPVAEQVARCIRSHSSPLPIGSATPEEICVSNADAISQIVRPAYWLYFAFTVRKCNFEDGRNWLHQRVESNWNNLIEPARALASDGYRLAANILSN